MYKLSAKIIGTLLAIVSLGFLWSPVYSTLIERGESYNMILNVFSLAEFSPRGGTTIILPLLILGVMYADLSDKTKSLFILTMLPFSMLCLYSANLDMRNWIYSQSTGFVSHHNGLMYYGSIIFTSLITFYISTFKSRQTQEL